MQRFEERFIIYVDTGLSMNERSAARCQPLFDHESVLAFESKLPWAFSLHLNPDDVAGQRDLTDQIAKLILECDEFSEFGFGTATGSVFLDLAQGLNRDFQGPAIDHAKDRVRFRSELMKINAE